MTNYLQDYLTGFTDGYLLKLLIHIKDPNSQDTQDYGLIGSHNSYSYMHWSNK